MMSFIRKRLTLANAIAMLALVFAMSGGALAATHATSAKSHKKHKSSVVITSVHQISKSVLAALKGAVGPVGPEGKPGLAGKDGSPGATGEKGEKGAAGSEGKSVVSKSFEGTKEPASKPCAEAGGDEFEVVGSGVKGYVCNGKAAPAGGESCSPKTSGTLASGCTETGQFTIQYKTGTGTEPTWRSSTAISFPTPLAVPLGEEGAAGTEVHFVKKGETATGCTGSSTEPTAAKGVLCVYVLREKNIKPGSVEVFNGETGGSNGSAGKTGALIEVEGEGEAVVYGSFAVTAP